VLRGLTPFDAPELLVGASTADDAAVWRIARGRALVATADFITPVVDDARSWGRIAAANAVSDVYAMGARPLLALNLVAWNTEELSRETLAEVLAGGDDIAVACGFAVGGGHTVDDPEPKYGMAVVGEVDPSRMLTNAGLRPGDSLILTKPLGTGVITAAVKQGEADASVIGRAVEVMARPNDAAARAVLRHGATAATDVTGFGLLGHARRLAEQSGVDLRIRAGAVPIIDGARNLAEAGFVPGGTHRNRRWASRRLRTSDGVDDMTVTLLADAQTSGGLLAGLVGEGAARAAVAELRESGHEAALIGKVIRPAEPGRGGVRLVA